MSVGIFQNDDYCNVCLYKTVLFEDKLLLQFLIQTILFIYLNKDNPYYSAFCSKIAQDSISPPPPYQCLREIEFKQY